MCPSVMSTGVHAVVSKVPPGVYMCFAHMVDVSCLQVPDSWNAADQSTTPTPDPNSAGVKHDLFVTQPL